MSQEKKPESRKIENVALSIRDAMESDFEDYKNLHHESWLATYPNAEIGVTVEDVNERFKDKFGDVSKTKYLTDLTKLDKRFKMMYSGGVLIGFVYASLDRNIIDSIYLKPEYIGKGFGFKLWEEAYRFLDKSRPIMLEVTSYNERAIKFYESLGFIKTDILSESNHVMPISKVKMPIIAMERPVEKI